MPRPIAMKEAKKILPKKVKYCKTPYEAVEEADALFLVTEWTEFRVLNYKALDKMKNKVIFDGRNIYQPEELNKNGFTYYGIGR